MYGLNVKCLQMVARLGEVLSPFIQEWETCGMVGRNRSRGAGHEGYTYLELGSGMSLLSGLGHGYKPPLLM